MSPLKPSLISRGLGWRTLLLTTMSGTCWSSYMVCSRCVSQHLLVTSVWPCDIAGSQGRNIVFLSWYTQPPCGHPGHGLHWRGLHKRRTQERSSSPRNPCSNQTWQENPQPLLLSHWLLRAISHHNGKRLTHMIQSLTLIKVGHLPCTFACKGGTSRCRLKHCKPRPGWHLTRMAKPGLADVWYYEL